MLRALLLSSLLVAACSGKKDAAPAPGSGSAAAALGSGSGSAAQVAAPPPAAKKKPPEPPEDRAGYRAGMAKGRKATDAKQYADAIKGFDAALAAKKGDPRALAERGFARFLEGSDLAAAAKDLDRAWSGTKDGKLLSMIWFNRGLVEEKLGNAPNATAAFVVANALRPTAAAQAKIAGKAACPVAIRRELAVENSIALDAPDWAALVKKLPHQEEDPPIETPTDKPPLIVTAEGWPEKVAYLVVKGGAGLRAIPLGVASNGRCPGTASFEIADSDATRIHVTGSSMYEGGYTFMCQGKGGDGDPVECTGAANEVSAGTACFGGTADRLDILFGAAGNVLLVSSQPDVEKPAELTLDPGGVKLTGLGCDRVEPLN